MFDEAIYRRRRAGLRERLEGGIALFLGNRESPINFSANTFPFRQDSSFLYYFGLDRPDLVAAIDVDEGVDWVFGDDLTEEALVWTSAPDPLRSAAAAVGIAEVGSQADLGDWLDERLRRDRVFHTLPAYREAHRGDQRRLFGKEVQPSEALIRGVVAQRSIKGPEEIAEIESALEVSFESHVATMKAVCPGLTESALLARAQQSVIERGSRESFSTILTVRGEVLHNPWHGNVIESGDLVLHDSGCESPKGYASDITRTFPASGRFNSEQRELYEIVLGSQRRAIEAVRPGVLFRDVHRLAARELLDGLQRMGIVRGNVDDALAANTHTLFFPCGLGHMLGLDVHDMEALGEDWVGYTEDVRRDPSFGWKSLRLGKALEPGFVITVEPGIYFNPVLMDRWRAEGQCRDFVDHDRLDRFRGFGGIRIEDDVLVTEESDGGNRVLGPPIPKSLEEIEALHEGGH